MAFSYLQAMTRMPRWMRVVRADVTAFVLSLETLTRTDMREKRLDDRQANELADVSRKLARVMVKLPAVRRIMGRLREADDEEILNAAAEMRDYVEAHGTGYAEKMRRINAGAVSSAEKQSDQSLGKMAETADFRKANEAIEARRRRNK